MNTGASWLALIEAESRVRSLQAKLRQRATSGMNPWRAGCGESRTSGSEGGPEKPIDGNVGTALRSDPYTQLKGPAKWTHFYLYVILDLYSRLAVGWMVARRESSALAQRLIAETVDKQGVERDQVTLHADRGAPMTAKSMALKLADLGVTKSHSRPHTSNDNPFSESQFKTLKYCPSYPSRFGSLEDARSYAADFFTWYNTQHRHSSLALLTPADVHYGRAEQILEQRATSLRAAFEAHPKRFKGRMPSPGRLPKGVWINPPEEQQ